MSSTSIHNVGYGRSLISRLRTLSATLRETCKTRGSRRGSAPWDVAEVARHPITPRRQIAGVVDHRAHGAISVIEILRVEVARQVAARFGQRRAIGRDAGPPEREALGDRKSPSLEQRWKKSELAAIGTGPATLRPKDRVSSGSCHPANQRFQVAASDRRPASPRVRQRPEVGTRSRGRSASSRRHNRNNSMWFFLASKVETNSA